jgi:hypothetical protein
MKKLSIIPILLLIIIFSCKKTTDPIYENDPKIYAKITDTNGNPLEGVGIHYYADFWFSGGEMTNNAIMKNNKISSVDLHSFTSDIQTENRPYQNYTNQFNPLLVIRFQIPKTVHVLLEIKNWWNSETIRTLVDKELCAGVHHVYWDGKDDSGQCVTNNLYSYYLTADEFQCQKLFFYLIDPESMRYNNCVPLSQSDSQGKLELEYYVIPFGKSFTWTDESGNEIGVFDFPDSLSLVFIKKEYKTLTKLVLIDTTQTLDISVVLEKE